MGFAAYNNGLSFHAVASESDITTGEVYFSVDYPSDITETELSSAFSGYTAALKLKKISELNADYQEQLDTLVKNYGQAVISDGTTEETKKSAIGTLKTTLLAEKATKRSAILNG